MKNTNTDTLKRLYAYIKNYKKHFYLGVFHIFIGSVAVIAFNATLSPLFDSLIDNYSFEIFIKYILVLIIIAIFITLTHYLGLYHLGNLAEHVIYDLRRDLFKQVQKLPMSYFDTTPHGVLMSTLTNDISALNIALEESISQVINSIVMIIGTFIMMMILSIPLTMIISVMMFGILIVMKIVSRLSRHSFEHQQQALGQMNGYVVEMLSGQEQIKAFNRELETIDDFNQRSESLKHICTKASIYGTIIVPIVGGLSYVAYSTVAVAGGYFVLIGMMSIGNIAAYLQFSRSFFNPVTQISNQMNTLLSALAGAERIFKLCDTDAEIDEGSVILKHQKWCKNDKLIDVKGNIEFEHVSFGYDPQHKIIDDLSFVAKANQKIALVGSTGAGKTTITNLLNRFYELSEGTISFDGINIQDIKKHDLRASLSMVLQDVYLFEGSIKENIRYGRLNATDEEVYEAAKLANADYFIQKLPEGYNTKLSANGENLSEGERQLLSIARTAISNPTVLVLDEATSSIDTRTEMLISEGMKNLMIDRTTFVIAHRLSTIKDADVIMVMDKGKIIEVGHHDELIKQKGHYYPLCTGQIQLT